MKKIVRLGFPPGAGALALASLAGCYPYDAWLEEGIGFEQVVAAGSSVYLVHSLADAVIRVDAPAAAGEEAAISTLPTGADPTSLSAPPGEERVFVLHGDEDFLLDLAGDEAGSVDLGGRFNRIAYAPDGRTAVVYISLEDGAGLTVDGSLTFDEIGLLDLGTLEVRRTRVGFNPHTLAFTPDGARLVVLSSDRATIVDVDDLSKVEVLFTLDATDSVTPKDVVVTDDGEHALISVRELPDLFDLRLVDPSVNILSLSGRPEQMCKTADGRWTVIVSGGTAVDVVDNLDPKEENTRSFALGDRVDRALCGEDPAFPFALLYDGSRGGHVAWRLRPDTEEVDSFGLENPADRVALSADGRWAAVVHQKETSASGADELEQFFDQAYALSLVDLDTLESTPRAFEGAVRDVLWLSADQGGGLVVAVDFERWDVAPGVDAEDGEPVGRELVRFQVPDLTWDVVSLPAPPDRLGVLAGGWLYVVHEQGLGGVSFVEATGPGVTTVTGLYPQGIFMAEPEAGPADDEEL
ncbi:hypothetical protein L6R50_06655 [Myxococcota bacterium]|nr:hypothetical protein [Myxococcota bacterium]